ncbi:alpha/beta fold hydrolase [uncultured Jatrophihabitans sp.]|uniref:alpha/beta fold hydrolase n=1 Tax=uncultured Jatrophihabitans sp. TaxID=1610747 RepID=UPI0035CA6431
MTTLKAPQPRSAPRPLAPAGVDGVHYTVTGDAGQTRTVVLLHGFSDNLTTWNRLVPALATSHRVIAIDLPGFGASTRRWTDPLLDGYVDVVAEVLDAEGLAGAENAVSFIGNSMGAAVSALFAARFPERTERVVLTDMPGLSAVPKLWRLAMSRPAELGLRTALRVVPERGAVLGLGWFYAHIAAGDPRRLDPEVRRGFIDPFGERGRMPGLLPIGRVLVRELGSARLGGLIGDSSIPTLIVFGSRDMLTPARAVKRLGHSNTAVVLPGCGHCPQIDQPDALLSEVLPFLRRPLAAVRDAEVDAA